MNSLAPSSKNVLWASLGGPTLAVQSWVWYACIWKGNYIVPLNHQCDLFCMLQVFHYRKDRDHLWSCLVSDCSDGNYCMATKVLMTSAIGTVCTARNNDDKPSRGFSEVLPKGVCRNNATATCINTKAFVHCYETLGVLSAIHAVLPAECMVYWISGITSNINWQKILRSL